MAFRSLRERIVLMFTKSLPATVLFPRKSNVFSGVLVGVVLFAVSVLVFYLAYGVAASGSAASTDSAAPLRLGVVDGPEAEVLEFVRREQLKDTLEITFYRDASAVRQALVKGEIDGASFENNVTLLNARKNPDFPLASVGLTISLPLAFYSQKLSRLDELRPGSRVVISAEPEAQGRALLLLYHYGLIMFDSALGPAVRLSDVTKNPREIVLVARPDAELSVELSNADLVALGYQAARQVGRAPARHSLAMEDAFSPFAQVLTIVEADREKLSSKLEEFWGAYRSTSVKKFIRTHFEDSVRRPW